MEKRAYSQEEIQALENARRRAAEKVRELLLQLEEAEREFAAATDMATSARSLHRSACSRENSDRE